ncbi:hypothetical protein GCM10010271_06150 [Streptomyces kurssanovii]|nr:hypothetical protein GCM10010271_06150 [Streptomyces kurssanovii]
MRAPHTRRSPSVGRQVGLAEKEGLAGRQLADDPVELSAGDGAGEGRQDGAGVPRGGAWTASGAFGDAAAELLDTEALRRPFLAADKRFPQPLRELQGRSAASPGSMRGG